MYDQVTASKAMKASYMAIVHEMGFNFLTKQFEDARAFHYYSPMFLMSTSYRSMIMMIIGIIIMPLFLLFSLLCHHSFYWILMHAWMKTWRRQI